MIRVFLVPAAVMVGACDPVTTYDLVIHDAWVIDLDSGLAQRRDVGIEGERIAAVSEEPLSGARSHDGAGLWMIPGLWDMHVHISDPSFFDLMIANGVVGARDMGGDATRPTDGCESIDVETLSGWRDEIEAGIRIGPRLQLAGPVLTGRESSGRPPATTPESARLGVAEVHGRGGDFVKVYEDIPPDAYRALMDEARRLDLPVAGHVSEETLTILGAVMEGQRSIEHVRSHLLVCFAQGDAELRRFFDADDWIPEGREWGMRHRAQCPTVWERLREGGTWLTPTLAVERTRYDGERPGFEEDPRRERLPVAIREAVRRFSTDLRSRTAEERAGTEAWWAAQLAFVARARSEGARLLAGSDAACEGVIPGYGLHDQLALFVRAGLTPLEALRTATVEPAAYFGRQADRGRIMAGAEADLVLLRGDPMRDISAVGEIEALVLRGRWMDRDRLTALKTGGRGDDPAQWPGRP